MKKSHFFLAVVCIVLAAALTSVGAFTGSGDFILTTIDYPNNSGYTHVFGINDQGDIVGQYLGGTLYRAFLRSMDGVFTTINVPEDSTYHSGAYDISPKGDIVCFARECLLLSDRNFTTIKIAGASRIDVSHINPQGDIVGSYVDQYGTWHGFLWSEGTYTTIDVPSEWGAWVTIVRGINARGDMVGCFRIYDGSYHGFLLHKGAFTRFDLPGAVDTEPIGMNDRGDIVGCYEVTPQGLAHGFLLRRGVFTTIDIPGALHTQARDINNSGEIVGGYVDAENVSHGFLASRR
jgi:uncharacterized membrane protein